VANGRVVGIVALCAIAAVVAVVGGTLLLSRHETTTLAGAVTKPRAGTPVIELEIPPSSPLRQAQKLLDSKHPQPAAAAAIFRHYASPEAKLGLAFAEWTGPSSLGRVQAIAAANPDNPAVALNLGWAYFQAGRNADAASAWQRAASRFPDSPYAVDALDALNPGVLVGLPPIVVDPRAVPAKARAALAAGVRSWDREHVISARRQLNAAARLAPNSPEALVAAAVARFSPASPKAPYPILGPLSGTFPHDSIIRLHLGLIDFWRKNFANAKAQLRLAAAEQPGSVYAKQARLLLQALGQK
jgi:tetratricopeptide (TPR) repeat protein